MGLFSGIKDVFGGVADFISDNGSWLGPALDIGGAAFGVPGLGTMTVGGANAIDGVLDKNGRPVGGSMQGAPAVGTQALTHFLNSKDGKKYLADLNKVRTNTKGAFDSANLDVKNAYQQAKAAQGKGFAAQKDLVASSIDRTGRDYKARLSDILSGLGADRAASDAIIAGGADRAENAITKGYGGAYGDIAQNFRSTDKALKATGKDARTDLLTGYKQSGDVLNRNLSASEKMLTNLFERGRGDIADLYQTATGEYAPYKQGGQAAQELLTRMLTDPNTRAADFAKTPGYQFALEQGLGAIDRGAAARGGLISGATVKDAQKYGTGLASQTYDNYINQLQEAAGQGLTAANAAAGLTARQGDMLSGLGQNQATATANNRANYANQLAAMLQDKGASLSGLTERTGSNIVNNQNAAAQALAEILMSQGRDLSSIASNEATNLANNRNAYSTRISDTKQGLADVLAKLTTARGEALSGLTGDYYDTLGGLSLGRGNTDANLAINKAMADAGIFTQNAGQKFGFNQQQNASLGGLLQSGGNFLGQVLGGGGGGLGSILGGGGGGFNLSSILGGGGGGTSFSSPGSFSGLGGFAGSGGGGASSFGAGFF